MYRRFLFFDFAIFCYLILQHVICDSFIDSYVKPPLPFPRHDTNTLFVKRRAIMLHFENLNKYIVN